MTTRAQPSRTIQRLHFDDLDPSRFESLCLALIFPLHPWSDIQHYGRMGTDGGIDILAQETGDDGSRREWHVQCRRYSTATKATLKQATTDALGKSEKPPDVLLVVVACDVRRDAHETYVTFAASRGVKTPLLWTASTLEARLYSERRDLLFAYFGISTAREARSREWTVVRNIALKKRLRRELSDLRRQGQRPQMTGPLSHLRAIIHSIDDTSYPTVKDTDSAGISGWFRLEMWDFYFNGLEFIIEVELGIIDAQGNWAVVEQRADGDFTGFREIKMFRLARIPFENIVEADVEGDEYYAEPHLYCRFANGGQPYEGFRHVMIDGDDKWPLDQEKRFTLPKRTVAVDGSPTSGTRTIRRRARRD